jgi:hypothetical protein
MKKIITLLAVLLVLGSCTTTKYGCPKPGKEKKFTASNSKPEILARVVKIHQSTVYLRYSYMWWKKKYDKIPDSITLGKCVRTIQYTRIR